MLSRCGHSLAQHPVVPATRLRWLHACALDVGTGVILCIQQAVDYVV